MTQKNGRGPTPPPISELIASRTDYEDVPVESLGGQALRVYALSGTARAKLVSPMVDLTATGTAKDPQAVMRVFMFQIRVVGASLGYPEEEWEAIGEAIGEEAIGQLFEVAARLSGLNATAQDEAVQRLPAKRNAASGTG